MLVTLGIDWNVGLKRKLAAELLDRVRAGMGAVVAARALDKQAELQQAMAEAREILPPPCSAVATPVPQAAVLPTRPGPAGDRPLRLGR